MKIYAFIFCRSGSKGLPDKNIKKLNGISLLERNINLLKRNSNISKIFVSTDSTEYKNIAIKSGACVPILRPQNLATDKSSEIESWKFMVNYLEENKDDFDVFISVPVITPLKTNEDINNSIIKFLQNKPDILLTVKDSDRNPYFNMVKEIDDNIEIFDGTLKNLTNRQNFPNVYDITPVAYIMNKNIVKKLDNSLFSNNLKIQKYKVSKINGIDIDDEIDFKVSELYHKERIKNNINFSVLNNIMLDEKTAIVTGGMGNIGEKIVETLVELNCKVIIIDLYNEFNKTKIDNMNENLEANIELYEVNLEKEEEIIFFCKNTLKTENIDILINCAALVGTSNLEGWAVPFESQSMNTFDRCMNVNVKAPIMLIQNLLDKFKSSNNIKIINISSIYGIRGNDFSIYKDTNMEPPIAYSISKSGLNIMTKYLSSLLGEYNICINTIILGGIFRNQDEKFVEQYVKKTPLKRMGIEDDIKGIISFLSSNLSNYVTGQEFVIDGGITSKI
jgi:CMP-N-acetylneuraminic acid synthetase/NAD(P)-dependent dehydrogenase (short-subunit alcohol dehydrogenase family)